VTTPHRERSLALVMAGLLGGAALANVVQLPALEATEHHGRQAFLRADSADLDRMGLEGSSTVRARRGLYLTLFQQAPGVDLLVGPGFDLPTWELHGLGRVDEIVTLRQDPTEHLVGLDIAPFIVADDDDGRYGPRPFAIALAGADPQTLVVRHLDERFEFVDVRLLPDGVVAELVR
jgi:hypothetical protein